MFGKKSQQTTTPSDLTSPKEVRKSQKVYDRIVSGECKDVVAELNATHGRGKRR
ncbi:hypothetical protein GCM10010387_43860 [Streptomyces inusitatus]|uniref:Uncharacterized protein n=2 Tax=Streptomyces inusitatus TaxID=68221 RepID=A0A918QFR7_9ACTN|nr:hypothetical protein GCM10010387_43860 [Streptomyces inusitatus]